MRKRIISKIFIIMILIIIMMNPVCIGENTQCFLSADNTLIGGFDYTQPLYAGFFINTSFLSSDIYLTNVLMRIYSANPQSNVTMIITESNETGYPINGDLTISYVNDLSNISSLYFRWYDFTIENFLIKPNSYYIIYLTVDGGNIFSIQKISDSTNLNTKIIYSPDLGLTWSIINNDCSFKLIGKYDLDESLSINNDIELDATQLGLIVLMIMAFFFLIVGLTVKDTKLGGLILLFDGVLMLDLMVMTLAIFGAIWLLVSPGFILIAILIWIYGVLRMGESKKKGMG